MLLRNIAVKAKLNFLCVLGRRKPSLACWGIPLRGWADLGAMLHPSRSSEGFCFCSGGPQGSSDPVTKKQNGTSLKNSRKSGQRSAVGQRRGALRLVREKGTCSQPQAAAVLGMGSKHGSRRRGPCLPGVQQCSMDKDTAQSAGGDLSL